MASTIDGNSPNRHFFKLVICLFDLHIILSKLLTLVLGKTTSNVSSYVWLGVTCSFLLINTRIWQLRLWCCIYTIMLGWSFKFITWRWSKWGPSFMPPLAPSRMSWNISYHGQMKEEHLLHYTLHVLHIYFLQFCYFLLTLFSSAWHMSGEWHSCYFSSHKSIIISHFPRGFITSYQLEVSHQL